MTGPAMRADRSRERIKGALRTLLLARHLSDITVAEVARAAKASRTTFYTHYSNLGEVYEELVLDFMKDVQSLPERLGCDSCRDNPDAVPFCEKLRDAGEWRGVVSDPIFPRVWLDLLDVDERSDYMRRLIAAGVTSRQARAILRFQIMGCLTVAQSGLAAEGDWDEIKHVLDTFIQGGFACIGAQFTRDAGSSQNPKGASDAGAS